MSLPCEPDLLAAVPETLRPVLRAYLSGAPVANDALYAQLQPEVEASPERWQPKAAAPASCRDRNLVHRKMRWHQQTLRQLGLLEKVPGRRGVWQLKPQAKELTPARPGMVLVAFSTRLGLALWSSCHDVFPRIDEPIALLLTSPPYPIRKPRAYGGVTAGEFTDFICGALEPIVANLLDGGSIALSLSPDCFEPGSPARSTYLEEATLALKRRFDLHLMDRIIWTNPARPPGPVRWASIQRVQLSATYEMVLWFTNNPAACFSDNRRVLQPHTERHAGLIARGGEKRTTNYGDGAYRLRVGSFGAETAGRIPRNVQNFTHNGATHRAMRQAAISAGLPTHGACMPLGLAKFLVEFLTRKDQLVVDCFGGWLRTALAAEQTGRRWLATELMGEHLMGAAYAFQHAEGFQSAFDLKTGGHA
ncbi:site-specific DNA-methyltransferase [Caenimonas koreensis DSM 17982]|uniref:site-specific DNA-methyltransferase (cytosine-N(4)-specific) n=1 Tax=Caenimonas koreensis DSM 17982 TaxID=1121255 RepID=A0A844BDA8_9BURK|nr:DNA methyltransferase [Caenimonas koreensis]MRD49689.1 site-specific DNA-methyltransferase [Caenimonas koreensis DSM 17982]